MECWPNAPKVESKLFKAISLVFKHHPYLLDFLFDPQKPRIRMEPVELLAQSEAFSAGEDLLVRVALDLWSGGGNACIWELIEILDDRNLRSVTTSLRFLRTKFDGWHGPVCRQLKTDTFSNCGS